MDSRRYNRALAQFYKLWLVCDPTGKATSIDTLERPKGMRRADFSAKKARLRHYRAEIMRELSKDARKWFKSAYHA